VTDSRIAGRIKTKPCDEPYCWPGTLTRYGSFGVRHRAAHVQVRATQPDHYGESARNNACGHDECCHAGVIDESGKIFRRLLQHRMARRRLPRSATRLGLLRCVDSRQRQASRRRSTRPSGSLFITKWRADAVGLHDHGGLQPQNVGSGSHRSDGLPTVNFASLCRPFARFDIAPVYPIPLLVLSMSE